DERRVRRPVAALRVGDDDIPLHLAGVGIERDQMRIRRRQVDRILVDRGAAMADVEPLIRWVGVAPQLPRRSGVDRPDVVRTRDVDDAVDENRRGLDLLGLPGLERPRQRQLTNVLRRDLRQLAVALTGKVAVVRRPAVLRRRADAKYDDNGECLQPGWRPRKHEITNPLMCFRVFAFSWRTPDVAMAAPARVSAASAGTPEHCAY